MSWRTPTHVLHKKREKSIDSMTASMYYEKRQLQDEQREGHGMDAAPCLDRSFTRYSGLRFILPGS